VICGVASICDADLVSSVTRSARSMCGWAIIGEAPMRFNVGVGCDDRRPVKGE
jgi:hypothetical protein